MSKTCIVLVHYYFKVSISELVKGVKASQLEPESRFALIIMIASTTAMPVNGSSKQSINGLVST